MATLLRRPGNLSRYMRRPANLLPLASAPTSSPLIRHLRLSPLNTSRAIRSFSTEKPNPPNNGNPNPGQNGGDKPPGKPESKLNPQDQKLLDLFLKDTVDLMGDKHSEVVREVCKQLERDGLPPKFKDIMEQRSERSEPLGAMEHIRAVNAIFGQTFKSDMGINRLFGRAMGDTSAQRKDDKRSEKPSQNSEGEEKEKQEKDPQEKEVRDEVREEQRQKQEQEQGKDGQGKEGKGEGQPNKKQPNIYEFKFDTASALISTILVYYIYESLFPGDTAKEITWQEFRAKFFDRGLVERLTVLNGTRVRVELNREAVSQVYADSPAAQPGVYYYFSIGSIESFDRRIDEAQNELGIPGSERIPVSYHDEVSLTSALLSFGPTLLLFGGLYWLSRRVSSGAGSRGGLFGMGKSRAKRFNQETDIKIKFSDVAGMDEAKVEIMEFVSFLKQPERFKRLGAKIPRGAILSGPPGTGKTLLAKATAGESGVPFFSVSGSEFVEMFVGVGPSRVRDLFANARKHTPCIVFIDEIDAIGKSRAKKNMSGGNDERESTLNQILTEMDGFNTTDQVVVLAGTNRPDVLDKALMRPGRFDRHIAIDRPTMEGRKQIFGVHLRKIVTSEDIEYLKGRLSALTPGFSGADIANCVNEAALVAARDNADKVVMEHFERAIERVIGGLEKKSLVLTPEQKRTVAYHEAGHAICGWYLQWADPLLKVSIIPRGQGALGYAQYLPAGGGDSMYLMNAHQLMDRMAMTLGGRISEELHFDTVTSGASDDFNKVTSMATLMVTKFGMSPKLPYIYYEDDPSSQLHKPFSDETARSIDYEVRRIVDEAHKRCRTLLTERKKELGMVAEELLSKEFLTRDDLIRILGPRPFPESGEFTKYFDGRAGETIAPPDPHQANPEETEGKDGRDQTPYPA